MLPWDARQGEGVVVHHQPEQHRSRGAHTGEDHVGRADRYAGERGPREQPDDRDAQHDAEHARPEPGQALRRRDALCPGDLDDAGREQPQPAQAGHCDLQG